MRQLGQWQLSQGYRVGIGLLLPGSWPQYYRDQVAEMRESGIDVFTSESPDIFGTGAMLYHQFRNPINCWVQAFRAGDMGLTVHFHDAWLSGAFMPLPDAKVIVTYHGIAGQRMLQKQPLRLCVHRYWAHRLVHCGAHHVSVDKRNVQVAEDLFGVSKAVFSVVSNGTMSPSSGVLGCPRLRDPAAPFTIGHVGVIDDGKGWRITAKAVRTLHEEGYHVRLLIFGAGPDAAIAESWCAANRAFAEYRGHSSNPDTDVFPLLDVLSLPSLGEGLPMSVVEAFSFAVPVVATSVGGLREAITNGYNGYLIERDPIFIAEALRQMIVDPALHSKLSIGAGEAHRTRFSIGIVGRAYEALYDREL